MVGVIGKAIKGFGKALKSRGRKPGVFDKVIGKGVVDRNVKSKEVFKTIQGLRKKPKGKFSTFPSEIVRTLKRGVVDRNVKSKEVFKTIQGLRKKPYKGAKENLDKIYKKKGIDYKKVKAFGKGALIGGAAVSGLEYKRRKDRGDYKKGKK